MRRDTEYSLKLIETEKKWKETRKEIEEIKKVMEELRWRLGEKA